ncbi:dephospho-CoA kinase [Flagellimonas sp.]|uniref:dephospho-CoA kinase n=1 Tax=Flagellimonas sp. TaxID=2058762 RepID=UPI003B5953F1
MMIVGLTGGIGSGKSTIAQMFRDLGVQVYDSDMEAKKMMVDSPELKSSITKLIGKSAYRRGKLNRAYIAKKVFKNPDLLGQLNAIVHPAVKSHFLNWSENQTSPYVIQETALIFENGSQGQYDYILLITAPLELRLQRVMERDHSSRNEVVDRIENQMGDDEKLPLADFHIENLDLKITKKKVAELHQKLIKLAN